MQILTSCLYLASCGAPQSPLHATTNSEVAENAARYTEFAVACDHAAASDAGAEVLRAGGNAADAAAAAMLALGVVNPASSGLGGGAFILHYRAADRSLTFLDARERAPSSSDAEMFSRREAELRSTGETFEELLSLPSQLGGLATGVPGEPAGIEALLTEFGRAPRGIVFEPAIRLAENGVEVSENLAHASEVFVHRLRRDPVMRRWLHEGADQLRSGQRITQPELAQTLRTFAQEGASALYQGPIAEAVVQANRAQGGILTMEDLAAYQVRRREPLEGEFFGMRWVTAPPPSAGGFTMLQSLALLEGWLDPSERHASTLWHHALAESWKGPYLDRARYFGDPDHVVLPLDALMGRARLDQRRALFDRQHATAAEHFSLPLPDTPEVRQPEGGGTSHLCVVDAEGNVTAVTSTINLPFGAGYTAAGMVMNDEMDDFARGVGLENAYGLPGAATNLPGPGRRPVSTMSPTIILNDRGPVLCLGASGGSRIVTAIQQVALNHLVLGQPLEQAVAAPRIHHQGLPDTLRSEESTPLGATSLDALIALGHTHELISNVAVVQAIAIQREGRRSLIAVSDPRKGGQPRGR